jgi:hypothetical protein
VMKKANAVSLASTKFNCYCYVSFSFNIIYLFVF